MIKLRGYVSSRPFFDQRIPQNIQNLVLRDFCQKNDFKYLLSTTEYSMKNTYLMLDSLHNELQGIDGVVFYSLYQLPYDNLKRNRIFLNFIKKNKKLYFSLENTFIMGKDDINKVENLWLIKKSLDNNPLSHTTKKNILKYIRH